MGILDDAIREHLELKRSHGAPDAEVRRQEQEVFGPAQAEAPPLTAADGEHTQVFTPDNGDELQPAPDDPYVVHPGDEPVPDPDDHVTAQHGDDASPTADRRHDQHHDDEPHPALVDRDHIGGEELAPEPVFGHAAAPVEEPPAAPQPVEEPPVEDPPAEVAEDEDVLEETPEFLQDAPEHDRLWFEQKPPRDFDFGE